MIRGDLGAEVGRLGRYPRLRQTDCECERRQLWGERQDKLMVDASMQLQNQQEEDKLIVRREEGKTRTETCEHQDGCRANLCSF